MCFDAEITQDGGAWRLDLTPAPKGDPGFWADFGKLHKTAQRELILEHFARLAPENQRAVIEQIGQMRARA